MSVDEAITDPFCETPLIRPRSVRVGRSRYGNLQNRRWDGCRILGMGEVSVLRAAIDLGFRLGRPVTNSSWTGRGRRRDLLVSCSWERDTGRLVVLKALLGAVDADRACWILSGKSEILEGHAIVVLQPFPPAWMR